MSIYLNIYGQEKAFEFQRRFSSFFALKSPIRENSTRFAQKIQNIAFYYFFLLIFRFTAVFSAYTFCGGKHNVQNTLVFYVIKAYLPLTAVIHRPYRTQIFKLVRHGCLVYPQHY